MSDIESKLRTVVSSVVKIPAKDLQPDDDLIGKYNVDSMQRIEIVISLEKEFGIGIPDDEASTLRTLADFARLIERYKEK